ncbi:MAG TPA: glycosyltransferase family 4 protein [Verrucomicrobiae bacterium]
MNGREHLTRTSISPKTIIYVGGFSFPDGDAGGLRVLGIGKALREAGYQVVFVGIEKRGRQEDRQPNGAYMYQGFTYVPEEGQGTSGLSRLKRAVLTHMTGSTTMRRLRAMDLAGTQALIAYHPSSLLLCRLAAFCRKRGIALVVDTAEWWDPRQVNGGLLGPSFWDSEVRMRWLQPNVGRVIAISSFLERYYRMRGCAVLRVPPLVDMNDAPHRAAEYFSLGEGVLRLVYAGSPGRKDMLGNAIRGLRLVVSKGVPVELHLVGPGPRTVAACLAQDAWLLDELSKFIVFHGRVAQHSAMGLVAQSDFSILLRPDKRYAHAGFPTKLVESLSLGVPVLTNPTSDIGEYVRDGKEGIILADSSPESFAAGVSWLLELPRARWWDMRYAARHRAGQCFDYRRYAAPLARFLGAGRAN